MNDDQLYYFLVDKNTRNVLQIEYPSDIDEFNKILGTSEGKGNLLKDLGIILTDNNKVFENPETTIKPTVTKSAKTTKNKDTKKTETKKDAKPAKKDPAKKAKTATKQETTQVNLFAGLFD